MRSTRVWIAAVVSLVAVLGGLSASARGETARHPSTPNDVVTEWNLVATSTLVQVPGPAGGAPPALQINMGMTQGAVYDALAHARVGAPYR